MNNEEEMLEFLAKDEEEAIKGYDDVISKMGDSSIVEQLKKIRNEEQAHLDFLRKAKNNPNEKYVDPGHEENEAEEAGKLFKMDFKEE